MSMTVEKAIEEIRFNMSHIGLGARAARRVKEAKEMAISALEEVQQYRAIGTVAEVRELKEKATAKQVYGVYISEDKIRYECPHCHKYWEFRELRYCAVCGQHIDWSEGKE